MNSDTGNQTGAENSKPQERVSSRLHLASELRHRGELDSAVKEFEAALGEARATPYEIEFQTRIDLAMSLAEAYQLANRLDLAREMLGQERAFAEKIADIMRATGTTHQARAATSGYLQIKDKATQAGLIGNPAPELAVREWLRGGPVSLAGALGKVVLLEFWATWCKPCREMFPYLNNLGQQFGQHGFEIISLTRHYLAYGATEDARNQELELMRRMVEEHEADFHVGVAEDEGMQAVYGANGLPAVVLVDRAGTVSYGGPGKDDPLFERILDECIGEGRRARAE